ncbi:hypothetical protein NDN08_004331 [Rhodosorus marinus]|uniref:Hexosyltransferase n=1 Tax=Rhodosorus marinus TaxID=101924 RepID=A0AAV8URJ7_9RHOD|nr:hypothetical protein NDN08_004331 [Rhodosorus marinus]
MEQGIRERGRKGRRRWTGNGYRLEKLDYAVVLLIALGILGVIVLLRSSTDELQTGSSSECNNLLIAIGLQDGNFLLRLVEGSDEITSWMNDNELISSSLCVEGFDFHDHYRERLSTVKAAVLESLASLRINLKTVALSYNGKLAVEVNNKPVDKFTSVVDDKYVAINFEKSFRGRLTETKTLPVVDMLDLAERRGVEPDGIVIVRFSGSPEDATSYLRMFLAEPRLGRRVKLLKLELHSAPTYLGGARSTGQQPGGKNEVEKLRRMLLSMDDCITEVIIVEEENYREPPKEDNGLFYAVLAGHATWTARVDPALNSWLKGVNYGRAAIFTNFGIKPGSIEAKALKNHIAVVAAPAHPDSEGTLSLMQSWSHLVRLRASWDLFMKQDTSLKYLILLDDDTFPFTDTFEAVLRECMDPNALEWGGSPESIRVDNGDGPIHGEALRQANLKGEMYRLSAFRPLNELHSAAFVLVTARESSR